MVNTDAKNFVAINKSVIEDNDLSLSAIGLYVMLMSGYLDLCLEDAEYREAFYELWGKNIIRVVVK